MAFVTVCHFVQKVQGTLFAFWRALCNTNSDNSNKTQTNISDWKGSLFQVVPTYNNNDYQQSTWTTTLTTIVHSYHVCWLLCYEFVLLSSSCVPWGFWLLSLQPSNSHWQWALVGPPCQVLLEGCCCPIGPCLRSLPPEEWWINGCSELRLGCAALSATWDCEKTICLSCGDKWHNRNSAFKHVPHSQKGCSNKNLQDVTGCLFLCGRFS